MSKITPIKTITHKSLFYQLLIMFKPYIKSFLLGFFFYFLKTSIFSSLIFQPLPRLAPIPP